MAEQGGSRGVLVLLGALLLVGVVVATSRSPVPPPPPGPDASLAVEPGRLTVTLGGVLVVPLLLRNDGPEVEVRRALVYAEPVAQDAVLQAPSRVAAGARRRFVALVAPDCRLLGPRTGLAFAASVLVRVRAGGRSQDLVLDLHAVAEVADKVARLCADSTTPAPGSQGRAPGPGGPESGYRLG